VVVLPGRRFTWCYLAKDNVGVALRGTVTTRKSHMCVGVKGHWDLVSTVLLVSLLLEGISSNFTQTMRCHKIVKFLEPHPTSDISSPPLLTPHPVPLATPADLEVTPQSYSTLRVSWASAPGATQYMILYSALNHGEPDDAKEVRSVCVCVRGCVSVCECVWGEELKAHGSSVHDTNKKARIIHNDTLWYIMLHYVTL